MDRPVDLCGIGRFVIRVELLSTRIKESLLLRQIEATKNPLDLVYMARPVLPEHETYPSDLVLHIYLTQSWANTQDIMN